MQLVSALEQVAVLVRAVEFPSPRVAAAGAEQVVVVVVVVAVVDVAVELLFSVGSVGTPTAGDLHFPNTEASAFRTLVQSPKDPGSSGLLHLVLAVLAALFRVPKLHDGSGDAKASKQSHVC